MLSINTQLGNLFLAEVGRGIVGGPLMLIGAIYVMDTLTKDQKVSFRIRHITWVVSTLIPVGIVVFAEFNISPLETLAYVSAFFCSVWVTYWGCRLIIDGGLVSEKDRQGHPE
jgi:hypothetical protein